MNLNIDLGHAILTTFGAVLLFFLRRELSRQDGVRLEVLKLVKACNDRLDLHESRLNAAQTNAAQLDEKVTGLRRDHDRVEDMVMSTVKVAG